MVGQKLREQIVIYSPMARARHETALDVDLLRHALNRFTPHAGPGQHGRTPQIGRLRFPNPLNFAVEDIGVDLGPQIGAGSSPDHAQRRDGAAQHPGHVVSQPPSVQRHAFEHGPDHVRARTA